MSTLLLRLAGPMQSWGTQSRFTVRDTGREPSKSGVIGLLCAALGWPREKPIDELASLRMGVRVDHEGAVQRDYQTAGGAHRHGDRYGVARADGSRGRDPVVSNRYFLADADFLVGLEGSDNELLRRLHRALAEPVWQLSLGRKAFVLGVPVWIADGLWSGVGLEDALLKYHWPQQERLRFVLEVAGQTDGEVRIDQPYGAAFADRRFLPRHIKTEFHTPPAGVPVGDPL